MRQAEKATAQKKITVYSWSSRALVFSLKECIEYYEYANKLFKKRRENLRHTKCVVGQSGPLGYLRFRSLVLTALPSACQWTV